MRQALLLVALFVLVGTVRSQEDTSLPPFGSFDGQVGSGEVIDIPFTAAGGEMLSLEVTSDGALDPVLNIVTETGAVLLQNDDYNYPETNEALLQAITIPYSGNYVAQVASFGDTGGGFTIQRLRGFAEQRDWSRFTPAEGWQAQGDEMTVEVIEGQLALSLAGNALFDLAVLANAERLDDYYAEVDVNVTTGRPGWVIHMAARQQGENTYYLLSVNETGQWRLLLRQRNNDTLLRDWVTHPSILPGETTFNLGFLVNENGLDAFYNGNLLGHFVDDTLEDGIIGFGAETRPALDSAVAVQFSNLRITTPLRPNDTDIVPQNLVISDSQTMTQEMERRNLIPSGGELGLNVPESSMQFAEAGVSRLPLGRGTTYTDFVLATTLTIQVEDNAEAGCGLFLRANNEETYTLAYITQDGGYGLAPRDGDRFSPGLYGDNIALFDEQHWVVVIANGDTLRYYIDGQYVGSLQVEPTAGSVGNAVVNFEPFNTNCVFENTWLWSLDAF